VGAQDFLRDMRKRMALPLPTEEGLAEAHPAIDSATQSACQTRDAPCDISRSCHRAQSAGRGGNRVRPPTTNELGGSAFGAERPDGEGPEPPRVTLPLLV